MKSDLVGKPKKPEVPEYPCLKISKTSGVVVLFTKAHTGTAVHVPNSSYFTQLGDGSLTWFEDNFETLRGTITLSN